jgi:hypothetical protein
MNFKKWVKSIQTAGYNGARTVLETVSTDLTGWGQDTVPEIIDSGPMCITDLFQNKSVAYFNPK